MKPLFIAFMLVAANPAVRAAPYRALESLNTGIRDAYSSDRSTDLSYYRIAVDPNNPAKAYLSTDSGFLFKTANYGRSWMEIRLIVNQPTFYGAIRSGGGGAKLGVGLSGSAKRLQAQLRAWSNRQTVQCNAWPYAYPYNMRETLIKVVRSPLGITPGKISLKQYLVMKGGKSLDINFTAVDPLNSNRVYAATSFGLFRSADEGLSWERVFMGADSSERLVNHVAVHPRDSRRVYIGTMKGLFLSRDGGNSWSKDIRSPLSGLSVMAIKIHVRDFRILFAATMSGVWKSIDGGLNWRWIYGLKESGLPAAFQVRRLALSHQDPRVLYIGTDDGMLKSVTGGEEWRPVSPLLFNGRAVKCIKLSPRNDRHIYTAVERNLWESRDGGLNWTLVQVPGGPWWIKDLDLDPKNPELLWVATEKDLYRLVPGIAKSKRQPGAAKRARQYPPLPPLRQLIDKALRYNRVHQEQLARKRKRAGLRDLLPTIRVSYLYNSDRYSNQLHYARWRASGYDPWEYGAYRAPGHSWRIMATWDLMKLLHNSHELQYGRIATQARWVRRHMRNKIGRYYIEATRLRHTLIVNPPRDIELLFTYQSRLREISSLLNIQTGGFVNEWQRRRHK